MHYITRRKVMLGAIASASIPNVANADIQCTSYNSNGIQACQVGVRIPKLFTSYQECENWCWAACIQTIFNYYGYEVNQESIVKRLYPDTSCRTATSHQILNVIHGEWRDDYGNVFYATPNPLLDLTLGVWNNNTGASIARALAAGHPLICGAVGHATVMTAMNYYTDVYTRGLVHSVVVRDPWPYSPNKRQLTSNEASGAFFLTTINVT